MRQKKRLLSAVALVASLGLVAAACGSDSDEETTTTEAAAETTAAAEGSDETTAPETTAAATEETSAGSDMEAGTTVGLLYDITGRGDKSFNDAAAAGLDRAKADFGVTAEESTPTGDADRADRLNLLAENNGLIIGVGFLWTDALNGGAAAHPDVMFANVDGVPSNNNGTPDDSADDSDWPNTVGLLFAEEQGSFLVGAAAALKSQSGTIGFVGGVEIPLIQKFQAGYEAGAKAVNPDIKILAQYISQPPDFAGFNDSAKGKEIAAAMYAEGADIVYHAAGSSGLGVFEAAKEAGEPGSVWAIGVDSDQWQTVGPDLQPYILTSMLKRVDVAVYETIKAYTEGAFEPGVRVFDLSVDGVGYATSGGFVDDIADQLDEYKAQIIAGDIVVPTEIG